MRFPAIERRSKRDAPRQCVSDYGMHKDAEMTDASDKAKDALIDELLAALQGMVAEFGADPLTDPNRQHRQRGAIIIANNAIAKAT